MFNLSQQLNLRKRRVDQCANLAEGPGSNPVMLFEHIFLRVRDRYETLLPPVNSF
jgi:hypothetical protein